MVKAMDHGAIEGATGCASDGSGSNGWCKRWIKEQLKELWVVQAMDQGAKE